MLVEKDLVSPSMHNCPLPTGRWQHAEPVDGILNCQRSPILS
jgi:hypothetical protein